MSALKIVMAIALLCGAVLWPYRSEGEELHSLTGISVFHFPLISSLKTTFSFPNDPWEKRVLVLGQRPDADDLSTRLFNLFAGRHGPTPMPASEGAQLIADEKRPGIELIHFRGGIGYADEEIEISNGLSNGLRVQVLNDDKDCCGCGNWHCFHVHDPETARRLATRLLEYADRRGDPPEAS